MISQTYCFVSNSCYIPGGWIITSLLRQHFLCRQTACCLFEKWWFCGLILKKPSPRWRGGEKKKGTRGRKDWEKEGRKGGEERNEAGLDSQRLAAVLLTIWVTPAAVFLRGEQKHLICHSFHFHSNTCKSFAFCQFYLFLSFLHMPLHFLNDNAVAISSAVHRPVRSVTCIQSCQTANSLLQTCRFFFHFFSPQKSFSPSPTVPLLLSGFHQQPTPPQSPDQIQILATRPLRDPARLSGSPGTLVQIICLTSLRQQMNQPLDSYND